MEMKKINIKRKQLNLSNSTAGMKRESDEELNKNCLKLNLNWDSFSKQETIHE